MSVLINMEMPDSCLLCPLMNGQLQTCKLLGNDMDVPMATRRSDCPLVLVPPHGDLIDRGALIKPRYQHIDVHTGEWYVEVRTIEAAPTIIPAEEGE